MVLGRPIFPAGVVLPGLEEVGPGQLRVVGTGFYMTRYGLFATAKHVLEDLCDPDTKALKVAYLFQQDDEGGFALIERRYPTVEVRALVDCNIDFRSIMRHELDPQSDYGRAPGAAGADAFAQCGGG